MFYKDFQHRTSSEGKNRHHTLSACYEPTGNLIKLLVFAWGKEGQKTQAEKEHQSNRRQAPLPRAAGQRKHAGTELGTKPSERKEEKELSSKRIKPYSEEMPKCQLEKKD